MGMTMTATTGTTKASSRTDDRMSGSPTICSPKHGAFEHKRTSERDDGDESDEDVQTEEEEEGQHEEQEEVHGECIGGNRGEQDISATASALVIAASDKAGMDNIDRSRIDAIILRESGNSKYILQQRKRDEQVNRRIRKLLQRKAQITPAELRRVEDELQPHVDRLQKTRCARSSKVVVDMDMFYMACELLSRPELDSKPCCVGSGMLLTSNYTARRYGVRSAMAGWIGDKLVEELSDGKERLIHVPANFPLYKQKSEIVTSIMAQFDPNMKSYSLDEAYLDIGPYVALYLDGHAHEDIARQLQQQQQQTKKPVEPMPSNQTRSDTSQASNRGSTASTHAGATIKTTDCDLHPLSRFPQNIALQAASEVVRDMRKRVQIATGGLTCSAGLAPNTMLAKIASDRNKPNGQCVVSPDSTIAFLHPMPTRKVPGIGRVTEKMLRALQIETVQQLYAKRALVHCLFHNATRKSLLRASLAIASHEVGSEDQGCVTNGSHDEGSSRKGISKERTFSSGKSWTDILIKLEDITQSLSQAMKQKDLWAQTITLKVKLHTFDVLSKCRTVPIAMQDAKDIVPIVVDLLSVLRQQQTKKHASTFELRLLGVRCSNFRHPKQQPATIQRFFAKGCKTQSMGMSSGGGSLRKRGTVASTVPTQAPIQQPRPSENNDIRETSSCPICHKALHSMNNAQINRHIDDCLGNECTTLQTNERNGTNSKKRKRQHMTDFFATL